jgi:two-component system copper resistance phosphate regulon response regulator CusR
MRVLIIEDSDALRESLQLGLSSEGFCVDSAADGLSGLSLARNNPYDVLVLDLLLPKLDGLSLLEQLRDKPDRPLVLILTARDGVEDRVKGLNAGADDYLVTLRRGAAGTRSRAGSRRYQSVAKVRVGELCVDVLARRAQLGSIVIDPSSREYQLPKLLARGRS